MTLCYLDASAWVKRYWREVGSEWIHQLFATENVLCCASLGFVEVLATLFRKRHAGEMDVQFWENARRSVRSDWDRFCHIELTTAVRDTAVRVAEAAALRGADAVHLASALVLQSRLETVAQGVIMVASDRELGAAARHFGLRVADPEQE